MMGSQRRSKCAPLPTTSVCIPPFGKPRGRNARSNSIRSESPGSSARSRARIRYPTSSSTTTGLDARSKETERTRSLGSTYTCTESIAAPVRFTSRYAPRTSSPGRSGQISTRSSAAAITGCGASANRAYRRSYSTCGRPASSDVRYGFRTFVL
jgi:hypothetical protein